ncbi:MAG TPA: inorganic phosphate transporter [Candidatus Saccharimonadales bacterium]|jgi:PiT family inorganic phosphate transporter|nr:inorganic phosphate transporter [Candidatus Saccharimonadales bacterium]
MSGSSLFVFAVGVAIAYANGSNDVSKGIATLAGSGVTNLRRAVLWGTLWTGVGAGAAAFFAHAMLQTFGTGLLGQGVQATLGAAIATIAGAALWVAFATSNGLPVSTTHGIVGSIAGVALVAYGPHGVNWIALGGKIILPLLLSPIVSLALTAALIRLSRVLVPDAATDCMCFKVDQTPISASAGGAATLNFATAPRVHLESCTPTTKTSTGITVNHLHWITSGATSFARALNDAPKMAALVLSAALLSGRSQPSIFYFIAITAGMVAGSWFAGRKVTEVLAVKVTRMGHREGFIANLVTAALVGPGAALGLPMSTTHVASGGIMGVAAGGGAGVNRKTVRDMVLAWAVTVPAAALFGVTAFVAFRALGTR